MPVPTTGNPFVGSRFYVNPDYTAEVNTAATLDPTDAPTLKKVGSLPTAIWITQISLVSTMKRYLDDALAQQQAEGQLVVPVFVVYDLPSRDCAAKASNGELAVTDGAKYQSQFIDPIAAQLAPRTNQRVVLIIEPDSLPNLATNLSLPTCAAAQQVYKTSIAYAINKLSLPNTALYLDAAHSGWIGWPNNQTALAQIFHDVLMQAGGINKIRGFATNTANYSVLNETPQLFDYQGNPCHSELTYVQQFTQALAAQGITNKGFVIDTSRNGLGDIRAAWGSWCNVHGAGLGIRPVVSPGPGVDAYLWVKPPGESDGTSDPTAVRFDSSCTNADATPGAPQAGMWFQSYFVSLVLKAAPPL